MEAFRRLSGECQFDWASMYVVAGAEAGRVTVLAVLRELPRRGPVQAGEIALSEARAAWDGFVTRGSAELEQGLKNVNPPCPLVVPDN
jgi:hypothetical protein